MEKVTREQLKKMNKSHRIELRQLEHMSETQFQVFRKNFSVGCLDGITKDEAHALLVSMLALNLELQNSGEFI